MSHVSSEVSMISLDLDFVELRWAQIEAGAACVFHSDPLALHFMRSTYAVRTLCLHTHIQPRIFALKEQAFPLLSLCRYLLPHL